MKFDGDPNTRVDDLCSKAYFTPHSTLRGLTVPYGGLAAPYGGLAVPYGGLAAPYMGLAAPYGCLAAPYGILRRLIYGD